MRHDNLVGDVEPEAEISTRGYPLPSRTAEGLEDERKHLRWDRGSVVLHRDDNPLGIAACIDEHRRRRRGVLDGVAGKVGKRRPDPIGVPSAGHVSFEIERNRRIELLGDVSADFAKVARGGFQQEAATKSSAGRIEQLRDHARDALPISYDPRDRARVEIVDLGAFEDQVGRHHDRVERVSQIVAENADEHVAKNAYVAELSGALFGALLGCVRLLGGFVGLERRSQHVLVRFALVHDQRIRIRTLGSQRALGGLDDERPEFVGRPLRMIQVERRDGRRVARAVCLRGRALGLRAGDPRRVLDRRFDELTLPRDRRVRFVSPAPQNLLRLFVPRDCGCAHALRRCRG